MPLVVVVLLAVGTASCRNADELGAPAGSVSLVGGVTATLVDRAETSADERVKWTTEWRLCWHAVPGAIGYDVQPVTSEGFSPRSRRQTDLCHALEVAKGVHERKDVPRQRALQLSVASPALAYRVRAVGETGVTGPWSATVGVGRTWLATTPPRGLR